jgi:methylaspartate ammonia-lyase
MDSLNRANISTSTTIGAYFGINLIDIALRYCLNRALVNAATASSAIITNFVCHFFGFLVKLHS